MTEYYRVIDIQIFKDSQWSSFYKTFNDINVINRVFLLIQIQQVGEKYRILDENGNIIDPSEISNKAKRIKKYRLNS